MNKYLNLGCGCKYVDLPEWVNVDFNTDGVNVLSVNILLGLPFNDGSIDAVFSSCMLEHFTLEQAKDHIRECYRVLKKGGIVRICVPDLEDICREYLKILDAVREDESFKKKYEYILIELIDQMTRMESGGEMLKYWMSDERDEDYIKYRTGYPDGFEREKIGKLNPSMPLKSKVKLAIKRCLDRRTNKFYINWKQGRFALSGEQHKWMYDSYNLTRLLKDNGFSDITVMKYNVSNIEKWQEYGLEVNADGSEYKPHSLYIEATKQ